MAHWYSDKRTCLRESSASSETVSENRNHAIIAFKKRYPSVDFASGQIPKLLRKESSATLEWLSTALRTTTGQDRIFAMAYLINVHPLPCMRYIDNLISLVTPAKQRDCMSAIDVLFQLFDRSLLPKDRVLIPFNLRPTNLDDITPSQSEKENLITLWLFEDELKIKYSRFVGALERLLMSDTIESFKRKALNVLSELAGKSPENRPLILGIIVNKLGDRSKMLASSVIHRLRILARRKEYMVSAIVQEVRSFLFRPNLLDRAKYYAVVFLSCLELRKELGSSTENKVSSNTALNLVKLYSSFFHSAVKSSDVSEKLVLAILTGLSRAAPFVPETRFDELFQEIDDLFRLVHTASFNVSLEALSVIFQLSAHRSDLRDRYYQALYRKLRDSQLMQTSRGSTVLHLLYRSLLSDTDVERGAAFAQRLLQLCLLHPSPCFVIGCLILLSKVQSVKEHLICTTQISVASKVSDVATTAASSGDEDEAFSDAPESDQDMSETCQIEQPLHPAEPLDGSWFHRQLGSSKQLKSRSKKVHPVACSAQSYRPDAREPMFARAGGHPSWSLVLLTKHVHPTVSLFATTLLQGKPVTYTGNPFDDFSLAHFLDRFAFKKPKLGGKSKRAPVPGKLLQRQSALHTGSRAVPVNSSIFRQLPADRIPADEQFFHYYAKFVESRMEKHRKTRKGYESDQSVSDDEFDIYLEKYEKGLMPTGEELSDNDVSERHIFKPPDESEEEADGTVNSGDEAVFEAMDGLVPAQTTKVVGKPSFLDYGESDRFMDVDLDADDDDRSDSDSEDEGSRRGQKSINSRNIESLFADAEEVERLYSVQETAKERKQRIWEENRAFKTSGRPTGKSRRIGRHHKNVKPISSGHKGNQSKRFRGGQAKRKH